MRRILSLVLVAAMLLCAMVITPAATDDILDANNVKISAEYFGGQLDYSELVGTFADGIETSDPITLKDGDASKGVLNLDGIIDDGEWTDVVYHISSEFAPENAGDSYTLNPLFETPSAENSYYYFVYSAADANGKRTRLDPENGLSYDIRFMWDEDYLYIAVEALDVDNIINQGNSAVGNNWDGDAFQFRVDPNGPNAIVGGKGYDATIDSFPYDKEIHGDTDNTLNCTFPWSDDNTEYAGYGQELHSTLGNFIISHHTGQGYTDICDASLRYFPEAGEPIENEDGTVTETTIWKCADASCYGDLEESKHIYASCLPTQIGGTWTDPICETVYEIAVPWDIIAIEGQELAPVEGDVLGISTVLFNRAHGQSGFNSYLEWGSGLCGYYTHNNPKLCGGTNALVLEGEDLPGCDHDFAEATCLDPITCTKCGYQKGYKAGHDYEFFGESLPGGSKEGSISAKCKVCNDVFTKTIGKNESEVRWDFYTTDTKIHDQGLNSGFTSQWEEIDPETGKYYEEGDPRKQVLWNPDGSAKCSYDTEKFGYAVADIEVSQTGTYFDADSLPYASFTEKMDVYIETLCIDPAIDDLIAEGTAYNPFFGQQFGGENAVGFGAGLVRVGGEYYFAILQTPQGKYVTLADLEDVALSITKATPEQIAENVWHEYVFFFDNNTDTAMLFWDNEIVASAPDYHLHTAGNAIPIIRRFDMDMAVKDIEIGSAGLANQKIGEFPPRPNPDPNPGPEPADKFTATINGVAIEYAAGETVEIAAEFYTESGIGYRFATWTGDVDVLADATAATATFTMPEKDVTLDAEFFGIGDLIADGAINGKDSNYMKQILAGSASQALAADIDAKNGVNGVDANLLLQMVMSQYFPEY